MARRTPTYRIVIWSGVAAWTCLFVLPRWVTTLRHITDGGISGAFLAGEVLGLLALFAVPVTLATLLDLLFSLNRRPPTG